VKTLKYINIYI